jgi:K+-sensing histidine kinase KdpD
MGIKRIDKKKLFKLFGFVQTTKEVNTRGIGLGLVISKKIVEMFDGDIGFISKWEQGSTFGFKVGIELGENFENEVKVNVNQQIDGSNLEINNDLI